MSTLITKTYIGGALTCLEKDIRPVYEKIGNLCRELGIDPFVPHLKGTDPIAHPDVTPGQVWQSDHDAVTAADIMIAYVGQPSLGTGGELEIARMAGKKIILWWFNGEKVSRLPRGNPAVIAQISAENENDLINQIKNTLINLTTSNC